MLFSASWIKLCKKEDKKWDGMIGVLNEIVYDLMKDERWDVSRNLLKFIFEDLKLDLGEINRRMLKINFALSQKEAEGKQDFEKILDSEDWNASSLDFQAAVACIRGDNKTALVLIKNGFKAQQIDKAALVDWPVFNRIRSLKSFKKLYIDLVGEKEAEKVSMEPVERHHFGPGMKLILDQAISQIERTDLKRLSEAADKQKSKSTAVVHHGTGEDVDVPFG